MNEYLLIFASFVLGAIFGIFVRCFAKFLALLFLAGIFFLLLFNLLKQESITASYASLAILAASSLVLLFKKNSRGKNAGKA
jgi:uncharacterized membrane protein (Fun14 family)